MYLYIHIYIYTYIDGANAYTLRYVDPRDPCHLKAPGAIKPYGYRIYGLRGLGFRGYRV